MPWDTTELIAKFGGPENAEVVRWLAEIHPHVHSDLTLEMDLASEGLENCFEFSPSKAQYSYVLLHSATDIIFALSAGMQNLALRLPEDADAAAADGASPAPDIGRGWVRFNPFDPDIPTKKTREKLKRWCAAAHASASTV